MAQRLAALALVLLSVTASAADPCVEDVKAFCPDVQPGSGRVNKCLADHVPQLSPSCQGRVEADMKRAKEVMVEFSQACLADTQRLCPNVQPGEGRMLKCLERNDYAVSPRCTAELSKLDTARKKVQELEGLCKPDVQRLCPGSAKRASELLECVEAHRDELSPACKSANPAIASEAATFIDTVDEISSRERIQDTVAILQGLNTVAFSRNQLALSFDYLQSPVKQPANLDVVTFNPLLVFGSRNEFAVSVKVPVGAVFPIQEPDKPARDAVSGVGAVNTGFGWAFYARGSLRQYVALSLQWNSASVASLGSQWVLTPVYAIAAGLAGWVSLTTELSWSKSLGYVGPYPGQNILFLRPILVFNLPSTTFLSVDTKLGWDFLRQIFVPVLRLQGGKLIGRDRDLSISAWYQVTLNTVGRQDTFNFGVGFSFSYFFDW